MGIECDSTQISCSCGNLPQIVKEGNLVFIDRKLLCEVTAVEEDRVKVSCKNSFTLTSNMCIQFPGVEFEGPIVGEEDEQDIIEFAIQQGIDYICLSNCSKASDVENMRNFLAEQNAGHVGIIAKIDSNEGLNNYEEILDLTDVIMICRADLSLEIPAEKVYVAQKWMIEKANFVAKPVLIAQ